MAGENQKTRQVASCRVPLFFHQHINGDASSGCPLDALCHTVAGVAGFIGYLRDKHTRDADFGRENLVAYAVALEVLRKFHTQDVAMCYPQVNAGKAILGKKCCILFPVANCYTVLRVLL